MRLPNFQLKKDAWILENNDATVKCIDSFCNRWNLMTLPWSWISFESIEFWAFTDWWITRFEVPAICETSAHTNLLKWILSWASRSKVQNFPPIPVESRSRNFSAESIRKRLILWWKMQKSQTLLHFRFSQSWDSTYWVFDKMTFIARNRLLRKSRLKNIINATLNPE